MRHESGVGRRACALDASSRSDREHADRVFAHRRSGRWGAIALVLVALHASSARGAPPPARSAHSDGGVHWNPRWPRVQWWELASTAALLGVETYVEFGAYTAMHPRWTGPILFDAGVRRGFRLADPQARHRAVQAADGIWTLTHIESAADLAVALFVHRDLDLAWQVFAMDAEVYAVVGLATRIAQKYVGRARPLQGECSVPNGPARCKQPPRSFWGGHFAMASAAAGLACVHHQFLPLYGGGWPDGLACGATSAAALAVGLLRMMSDSHYATDTLIGGAFGFLVGYWLPRLLHYDRVVDGPTRRVARLLRWLSPTVGVQQLGLTVHGAF